MIVNHIDNHALFLQILNHGEYKPLMDAYGDLLTTINHLDIDGETRSKLFELATDAVERAENNAFDKGAELQAAITRDELTAHEDEEEAPSEDSASGEEVPDTKAHVEAARAFVEGLTDEQLKEFGHDDFSGRDQLADALDTIEKLAQLDNTTAWDCYTAFLESNLSGVHFVVEKK